MVFSLSNYPKHCMAIVIFTALASVGCSSDNSDSAADGTGSGSTSGSSTTGTGTSDSSAGVLCDYSDSTFNDSASVNATSTSSWTCSDTERELVANGIPDHAVGTFPNQANPNTISEQDVSISYTLAPVETNVATDMGGPRGAQGHVLNGIKIDAGTGGSCTDNGESCDLGDNSGSWSIEALTQTVLDFGADDNNAHVQPDGTYHYHGLPEGFVAKRITETGAASTDMILVAWAADGFPIYARYGYDDASDASSGTRVMTGSYQHISTVSDSRPDVDIYPMGTFQQDWEYVEGAGDLDECNGRTGVTPEFPGGIYHYYTTDSYPFFQRCVKGQVDGATDQQPPRM